MMKLIRTYRVVLIMIVMSLMTAFWTGCSPRKMMVNQFIQMVETGLPALEQEDDLQLLAQSMPAHIKLLETLLASDPENIELLVLLARLYGGYAFAILETEYEANRFGQPSVINVGIQAQQLEAAVARTYQKGTDYALRALEVRHSNAAVRLGRLKSSGVFIKALRRKDMPALFWYGFNLGGVIQHRLDSVAAMSQGHLVEKIMRRVVALDPSYYHGSAHLVLMTYYASRSAVMGGNPDMARFHREKHFVVDPGSMMLRSLFWTRHALVRKQARKEFVRNLSHVADKAQGEQKLNMLDSVAAVRAAIYLKAVDRFFDE